MPNPFFHFKQFSVFQERSAMKVCTDSCLFGSWVADFVKERFGKDDLDTGHFKRYALDIGAGTGLLSLMVAQKTDLCFDAIEKDPRALTDAKANFSSSPWAKRLEAVYGDVRDYDFNKKYELIISNPPFFNESLASPNKSRKAAMQGEGNLTYEDVFCIASELLAKEGIFALLLPSYQEGKIDRLAMQNGFIPQNKLYMHLNTQKDPTRIAIIYSKGAMVQCISTSVFVKKEDNDYSDEFIALLRDYYLAF